MVETSLKSNVTRDYIPRIVAAAITSFPKSGGDRHREPNITKGCSHFPNINLILFLRVTQFQFVQKVWQCLPTCKMQLTRVFLTLLAASSVSAIFTNGQQKVINYEDEDKHYFHEIKHK